MSKKKKEKKSKTKHHEEELPDGTEVKSAMKDLAREASRAVVVRRVKKTLCRIFCCCLCRGTTS